MYNGVITHCMENNYLLRNCSAPCGINLQIPVGGNVESGGKSVSSKILPAVFL